MRLAKSTPPNDPRRTVATEHTEPTRGGEGRGLEGAGEGPGGVVRPGRSKACGLEKRSHLRAWRHTPFTASVGARRRPATGTLGVLRVGPLSRSNRAEPRRRASHCSRRSKRLASPNVADSTGFIFMRPGAFDGVHGSRVTRARASDIVMASFPLLLRGTRVLMRRGGLFCHVSRRRWDF